jgi:lysophospholipase L1-like esterase
MMSAPQNMATPRRVTLGAGLAALATTPAKAAGGAQDAKAREPGHVVLLGDSVLDNGAYVSGGPDVMAHLRTQLPGGWQAGLAAVDGAVVSDVRRQMERVSGPVTHLVVSAGGNDALRREGLLAEPVRNVAEAVQRLAEMREAFRRDYRAMLEGLLARRLPLALCTIYDPRFPDRQRQDLAVTGLALFNDVILREAFRLGLPLIDLRLVCNEDGDFANPIEPSVQGGRKIAAAITRFVTGEPAPRTSTVDTGGPG